MTISGYLAQMGPLVLEAVDPPSAYGNPFFCPDPSRIPELEDLVWRMREAGDSIGARVTVIARGVPPGLGEPVFERLDADIAGAMMGINAVKGVEIGDGFRAVEQRGSQHRDELTPVGIHEQSCRRRARRYLLGAGYRGEPRAQAHLEHHGSRARPSTSRAMRARSRPPGGTIRASAFARRRSRRR